MTLETGEKDRLLAEIDRNIDANNRDLLNKIVDSGDSEVLRKYCTRLTEIDSSIGGNMRFGYAKTKSEAMKPEYTVMYLGYSIVQNLPDDPRRMNQALKLVYTETTNRFGNKDVRFLAEPGYTENNGNFQDIGEIDTGNFTAYVSVYALFKNEI